MVSCAGATPEMSRSRDSSTSRDSLGGSTRVPSPEGSRPSSPSPDGTIRGTLAKLKAVPSDLEACLDEKAPHDKSESPSDDTASSTASTVVGFPEGGRDAWMTVAGATLLVFSTFGLSNIGGVFVAEYHRVGGPLASYPLSTVSWITSTHLFLCFGSSFASGLLFDRGYFRWQILGGTVFWIVGIFSLSAATTFIQIFLAHGVCLGLAVGAMFGPALSACASYFKARRALVVGCCTAGAGLGAMFFDLLLNYLFPRWGYAPTVRLAGYLMTALLVLANLLMRPRVFPARPSEPIAPMLALMAREPAMWFICLGSFATMCGLFIPLIYIQVYATAHGADATLSLYSIAVLNAAATVARVVSGLLGDRLGKLNCTIPLAAAVGVMCFAMLGATDTVGASFFLVIFGCASGGFIALVPSTFIGLAADVNQIGIRSGLGFSFIAVAALIGSPIAGALLSAAGGNYAAPCAFGGAMALTGAGLLFAGRRVIARKTNTWKL